MPLTTICRACTSITHEIRCSLCLHIRSDAFDDAFLTTSSVLLTPGVHITHLCARVKCVGLPSFLPATTSFALIVPAPYSLLVDEKQLFAANPVVGVAAVTTPSVQATTAAPESKRAPAPAPAAVAAPTSSAPSPSPAAAAVAAPALSKQPSSSALSTTAGGEPLPPLSAADQALYDAVNAGHSCLSSKPGLSSLPAELQAAERARTAAQRWAALADVLFHRFAQPNRVWAIELWTKALGLAETSKDLLLV
jgi:hypothetical protein